MQVDSNTSIFRLCICCISVIYLLSEYCICICYISPQCILCMYVSDVSEIFQMVHSMILLSYIRIYNISAGPREDTTACYTYFQHFRWSTRRYYCLIYVFTTFQMVHAKILLPDVLQLMLNVSELAKQHIEQYFKLSEPLYFSYTHLVCRTSKTGNSLC